MNKMDIWMAIHSGIESAKPIEKQIELLLLRELFYQIQEVNSNLKCISDKLNLKEKCQDEM